MMYAMRPRTPLIAMLFVLACTLAPAVAAAQVQVDPAPETNRYIPLAVLIVLGLGLLVASFLGSRRGHRD